MHSTSFHPIRRQLRSVLRTVAIVVTTLASATRLAAPVGAQSTPAPSRPLTGVFSGTVYGQVSDPQKDFGKNAGTGWGGGASGVLRIDKSSIINLRGDLSVLTYGSFNRRINFPGAGGLVKLDLNTRNNIFSFVAGPQLLGPTGVFTPYASVLGGFSVFWTSSSLEGSDDTKEPFASSTNSSDAVLAYGAAAGAYIRVYNGARPIRLDLGARVLRHDNVSYLTDQRVREAFEQDRDPIPVRGRADFVAYYLGVHAILF